MRLNIESSEARYSRQYRERQARYARDVRLMAWHKSFALLPVSVSSTERRWLEIVERKATRWTVTGPKGWIYRAIDE